MKSRFSRASLLLIIFFFVLAPDLPAQGIRKAVWAGQFFESDPGRLSRLLDVYLEAAQVSPPSGQVVGIIVPHAGYVYSGQVAAKGYKLVKGLDVDSIVVIGPSHQYGFNGCSIYLKGGFETPLGVAEVDENLARQLAQESGFGYIPEAQAKEHSIEVQIPFIQKTFPKAKIVPVVMGYQTEKTVTTLSETLSRVLPGKKALVVASTDMSHFLPRKEANKVDNKTIELIKAFDLQALMKKVERGENLMCGGGPVLSLMGYAQKIGRPKVSVLSYSDSASSGGPEDRVVGYLAAAIHLDEQSILLDLTEEEKRELLSLARKAIEVYLETGHLLSFEPENQKFKQPAGAFVTIRENRSLRGCIGFAEPILPLAQTIIQAAVYAATQDPRFPPLRKAELPKIEIEISVLGPLQPVANVSEIKVGQHGLIIKLSGRSGLLLPQVATEYHWDRQTFLQELCRKAGLPDNAWKNSQARLLKFEAVVFHE